MLCIGQAAYYDLNNKNSTKNKTKKKAKNGNSNKQNQRERENGLSYRNNFVKKARNFESRLEDLFS